MLSDPLLLKKIFHEVWTMGIAGNGYASPARKGELQRKRVLEKLTERSALLWMLVEEVS